MPETQGAALSEALRQALRRLLRPLAKAMIQAGLTFPAFVELAREVYVDVTTDDFAVDGRPPSHSRVAILSGVHRKEVRRLAGRDRGDPGPPPALPLSAKVVAVWTSEPDYLDADGRARPLPRTAPDGLPSFERLVSGVSKDVRPRALLEEWRRHGVAELKDDVVTLRRAAFIPDEGYEDKAYYFGRNLRDHIAAGAHNLAGGDPPFFDRAVYYDRLKPASVEKLRAMAEEKAMALILEINKEARLLAEHDRAGGEDGGSRFTFGAYFFADPPPSVAGEDKNEDEGDAEPRETNEGQGKPG